MGQTYEISEMEENILKAALKVVNEETISGTRMHLIAEKAKMVQSNVHYYYKTKDDLMLSLQHYVVNECVRIRTKDRKKVGDTLEEQLHIFFQQKIQLLTKRKDLDFAEMDFIVQSKNNAKIRGYFDENYQEWREEIREVLRRYCPELGESDREMIPYLVISLLEGATVQALIGRRTFDIDAYMESAEKMVLDHIARAAGQNG